MVNTVMLVGRLVQDIEVKTLESGRIVTNVPLAVSRGYKNQDGIYETDFFDCVLWDGIAQNASDYCHKGDVVGIRGRLQSSIYEKDSVKHKAIEVVVEKLTFLSSKKKEDEETKEVE